MPGDREDLPDAGTEGDFDLKPEFTFEELISDTLRELGDVKPPDPKEGWVSVTILRRKATGLSMEQIRDRLEKMRECGEYERIMYKNTAYYRRVKPREEEQDGRAAAAI